MAKLNKTCCVCGEKYHYCNNHCMESLNKPSWMASFDTENCKHIYEAAAGYFGKAFTADEAKLILDTCDLSKKENFSPSTQRLIKEIYENATEISVEEKQDVAEGSDSTVLEYKPNNNFKKKKNKNR